MNNPNSTMGFTLSLTPIVPSKGDVIAYLKFPQSGDNVFSRNSTSFPSSSVSSTRCKLSNELDDGSSSYPSSLPSLLRKIIGYLRRPHPVSITCTSNPLSTIEIEAQTIHTSFIRPATITLLRPFATSNTVAM